MPEDDAPTALAITAGEPAGIGPDLIVRLAQQARTTDWLVVGAPSLLADRARRLGVDLRIEETDGRSRPPAGAANAGALRVVPVDLMAPAVPGALDPRNVSYVLATLERALALASEGSAAALVTAPVHKAVISDAGVPFSGHTEWFAERTGGTPVMLLVAGSLRVALATTHLPLAHVPAAIRTDRLRTVLEVLHRDLRERFGIDRPRLGVCGLNPHAGESGLLGREEIDRIEPAVRQAAQDGLAVTGPLPADTIFVPGIRERFDAILAMYHDQGLPVLKAEGFGRGVNVTLGLPVIRTSVDHGTALDLAGTDRADPGSLGAAIALAEALARRARGAPAGPPGGKGAAGAGP